MIKRTITTSFICILVLMILIPAKSVYAIKYEDGTKNDTFQLQTKKWTYVRTAESESVDAVYDTLYFRFKATETGWLDVEIEDMEGSRWYGAGWVSLCDSEKRVISSEFIHGEDGGSDTIPTFGVRKGKLYYVKVDQPEYKIRIKISNEWYSESYGKSRKKAKNLKRNELRYGTFAAGEKNLARWYKVKLRQKRKMNFKFNKFCVKPDGIRYKVINSKGKSVTNAVRKNKRLPRGIYYIKVYKKGRTSGSYDLKWK